MNDVATSSPTTGVYAQSQSAELAEASELEKTVVKLYREGKYQEALSLAKRVLQIREKVPNLDVKFVRSALLNLAELYLALGKYGDAESSFERVITSDRSANPNDIRLAKILEKMALVRFARGNQSEAESAYQEALRLKESVLGTENPSTMHSVLALAEFYQFSGEYAKAIPYYHRLLAYREKTRGPKYNEERAEVVDRYACALRRLNRSEEANNLEMKILGPAVGTRDPSDATTLGNVLNGRALKMPRPSYPAQARLARLTGTVVVRVVIDEKGNVIRACAIKGHQMLARTSELAAYGAKFTPTKLSGIPVKVTGLITYNYVQP